MLREELKSYFSKLSKLVYNNLITFLDIIFLLVAGLSIYLIKNKFIVLILIIFVFEINKFIIYVYNKKRNTLPILNEDLTERNHFGDIIVKKGKINQLIIYCNMVEDYIRSNNLRN